MMAEGQMTLSMANVIRLTYISRGGDPSRAADPPIAEDE